MAKGDDYMLDQLLKATNENMLESTRKKFTYEDEMKFKKWYAENVESDRGLAEYLDERLNKIMFEVMFIGFQRGCQHRDMKYFDYDAMSHDFREIVEAASDVYEEGWSQLGDSIVVGCLNKLKKYKEKYGPLND